MLCIQNCHNKCLGGKTVYSKSKMHTTIYIWKIYNYRREKDDKKLHIAGFEISWATRCINHYVTSA